jgi:hypothetical protein
VKFSVSHRTVNNVVWVDTTAKPFDRTPCTLAIAAQQYNAASQIKRSHGRTNKRAQTTPGDLFAALQSSLTHALGEEASRYVAHSACWYRKAQRVANLNRVQLFDCAEVW